MIVVPIAKTTKELRFVGITSKPLAKGVSVCEPGRFPTWWDCIDHISMQQLLKHKHIFQSTLVHG